MTTYKQGQDWQRDKNENIFLKMKVKELEEENEKLHQEIRDMQATAEFDDEVLDEVLDEAEDVQKKCNICGSPLYFDLAALTYRHQDSHLMFCGVGHDPSGNEY